VRLNRRQGERAKRQRKRERKGRFHLVPVGNLRYCLLYVYTVVSGVCVADGCNYTPFLETLYVFLNT
jgi:hypothetical protein